MQTFAVVHVDQDTLRQAIALDWPDFQDAVCSAAAEACGCDAIVTRDPDGLSGSPVEVIDPATAQVWLLGE